MIRLLFLSVIATSTLIAQPSDALLLERAGRNVDQFWHDISLLTCIEELSQEKLNENGKVVLHSNARYDNLILLNWDGDRLLADESRVEIEPPRKGKPTGSLLATRGFATLLLILHPAFQPGYSFSLPEIDPATGLARVAFMPRAGGRSPGAFEVKGREIPIAWEGAAWIDPATAAITRIEARWSAPPEEIGLRSLESEVRYAPLQIHNRSYWVPQRARVELHTAHQGWRNQHEFTGYRAFGVAVDETVKGTRP